MLPHRDHAVECATVDQAEVAGVGRDLHVTQSIHDPVEPSRGHELAPRLARTRVTHGVYDVVALTPSTRELERDFGSILEVGVHDDDRLSPRVVEPRGDGDLMAAS